MRLSLNIGGLRKVADGPVGPVASMPKQQNENASGRWGGLLDGIVSRTAASASDLAPGAHRDFTPSEHVRNFYNEIVPTIKRETAEGKPQPGMEGGALVSGDEGSWGPADRWSSPYHGDQSGAYGRYFPGGDFLDADGEFSRRYITGMRAGVPLGNPGWAAATYSTKLPYSKPRYSMAFRSKDPDDATVIHEAKHVQDNVGSDTPATSPVDRARLMDVYGITPSSMVRFYGSDANHHRMAGNEAVATHAEHQSRILKKLEESLGRPATGAEFRDHVSQMPDDDLWNLINDPVNGYDENGINNRNGSGLMDKLLRPKKYEEDRKRLIERYRWALMNIVKNGQNARLSKTASCLTGMYKKSDGDAYSRVLGAIDSIKSALKNGKDALLNKSNRGAVAGALAGTLGGALLPAVFSKRKKARKAVLGALLGGALGGGLGHVYDQLRIIKSKGAEKPQELDLSEGPSIGYSDYVDLVNSKSPNPPEMPGITIPEIKNLERLPPEMRPFAEDLSKRMKGADNSGVPILSEEEINSASNYWSALPNVNKYLWVDGLGEAIDLAKSMSDKDKELVGAGIRTAVRHPIETTKALNKYKDMIGNGLPSEREALIRDMWKSNPELGNRIYRLIMARKAEVDKEQERKLRALMGK